MNNSYIEYAQIHLLITEINIQFYEKQTPDLTNYLQFNRL